MPVLGETTTVVLIPVRFFQMKVNFVTLQYLIILISEAETSLQAYIWSYPKFVLVLQNTVYNQEIYIFSLIISFSKRLKILNIINFWMLLMLKE